MASFPSGPGVQDELGHLCLSVARHFQRRPGYRLLHESELAARLLVRARKLAAGQQRTAGGPLSDQVARLVQTVYAEALCQACRSENIHEQNRGYAELGAYLHRLAYHALKTQSAPLHLAEDCAQEALQQVWQHVDDCREPGAFLRWAAVIVMRIVQRNLRRQHHDLPLPEED
ncbi:MAG: sigma factor [Anaerolineae bacterium]|nr:sigma factor [Anaerolineae bacterium]